MARTEIRFAVRDDGLHAATWTLVFKPQAADVHVYLFCRVLGRFFKTSFHPGKWRHAYVKEAFESLFDGIENAPEDRCIDEWDPPSEMAPGTGVTKALSILTPWSTPHIPIASSGPDIVWIPSAPKPRWTEIGIYFLGPNHRNILFPPGSEPNGVIATEPLGDGRSVHIVYMTIDPPAVPDPQAGGLGLFSGRKPEDLRRANAALALSTDSQGLRLLFDFAVQVNESAVQRLKRSASIKRFAPIVIAMFIVLAGFLWWLFS